MLNIDPQFENGELDGHNLDFDTLDLDENIKKQGFDSDELDLREQRRPIPRAEKRISKLVFERNSAQDENARLRAENEAFQKRLEELGAKVDSLYNKQDDTSYATQKATLQEALRVARAAEDFEAEQEAQEKLSRLYYEQASREREAKKSAPEQKQESVLDEPRAKTPQHDPLAVDWMARNQWAQNPKNYAVVNSLFIKLQQEEGYSESDPDLYEELDRRIKQIAKKPQPAAFSDQDNVSAVGENMGGMRFTSEDRNIMRKFGLDPDDKVSRVEYLKNKAQLRHSQREQR